MSDKTVEFDELLSSFSVCGGPSSFPLDTSSPHFRYELDENERFVAPTFRVEREPIKGKTPSVVLISASAAVGKSTVACALAHKLEAPLWDLSQFTLGDGTFTGIPRKHFGSSKFNEVEARLRSGSFLYILDALDEARARTSQGFDSFLQELCKETASELSKASLVLLGRTEACLWTSLFLEENDVTFAHYSIDFFSRSQSEAFIDRYLDRVAVDRGHQSFHRTQRVSFLGARDSLFSTVFELLGDNAGGTESWNEAPVREFVGYSPVLEVLADFLNDTNYHRLTQQMSDMGTSLYSTDTNVTWKFLRTVVTNLLEREQRKQLDAFRSTVEVAAAAANWNAWDSVYGFDEQCERILCNSFSMNAPVLPQNLPLSIQQPYEDSINMADHPFVKDERHFANVVFRDYLFSWALKNGSTAVKKTLKTYLAGDDYRPSPLLAHFYLVAGEGDETGSAEPGHLGYVYESLLSKELVSQQISFTMEADRGGDFYATFGFGTPSVPDISFPVIGSGEGLVFSRFLRNADITSPEISFGWRDVHFDLGPAVRVDCGVLRTSVSEIRVLTDSDDGGDVILESKKYERETGTPLNRVLVKGPGDLLVNWPDLAHPWAPYKFVPATRGIVDARFIEAVQRFASILAPFRRRGFDELTRSKSLIDNRPVGRTPMGGAMMEYLLETGILAVEGKVYRLERDRLSELKITWQTLMRREVSDELRVFLRRFLERCQEQGL